MSTTNSAHSYKPPHMKSEQPAPAECNSFIRNKYTRHTRAVSNHLSYHEPSNFFRRFALKSSYDTFLILFFATHARVTRYRTHQIHWRFFSFAISQIFYFFRRIVVPHFPDFFFFAQFWATQYPSYATLLTQILAVDSAWSFVLWCTHRTTIWSVFLRHIRR